LVTIWSKKYSPLPVPPRGKALGKGGSEHIDFIGNFIKSINIQVPILKPPLLEGVWGRLLGGYKNE
jgi:hypothetical protein